MPDRQDQVLVPAARTIDIALATYNGAAFLPEMLGSLFSQSCQDFNIVVADDKSEDATMAILAGFQTSYPGRIRIVGFSDHCGGAAANFARLTRHLSADYCCFADQDDVWLPHKVASSLQRMRSAEARCGSNVPLLIHTDLRLVDAKLRLRHGSFWRHVSVDPRRHALRQMLIEISVAGCTLMANRALYELARPIPPQATMHDHWFALVASAFGRVEYIPHASVLYRRHAGNVSRRRDAGLMPLLRRVREVAGGITQPVDRDRFSGLARQAAAFLTIYRARVSPEQVELLTMFAGLTDAGRSGRCTALLRRGVLRTGILRNLALFYLLSRW